VSKQRTCPPEDGDVADTHLVNRAGFDVKHVARLDAGEHARALGAKRDLALIGENASQLERGDDETASARRRR
jgi:hypothetical protein